MAHLIAGKGGKDAKGQEGAPQNSDKDNQEPLDMSEFALPTFEDGACPCCFQKYGDQDHASWTDLGMLFLWRGHFHDIIYIDIDILNSLYFSGFLAPDL